jgi:hypothetical protein
METVPRVQPGARLALAPEHPVHDKCEEFASVANLTIGINDPAFAHKLSIHNLWVFFYSVLTQIISGYQDRMNNIPGSVSGE